MLAWRISESVKVNALPGPWPMLLYTWIIAHCDNLGRFHGEPCQVRGLVFPKQKVTDDQVVEWLGNLSEAGLIHWYVVDNLRYLSIPPEIWNKEQKLHRNMSRDSDFPPLPDIFLKPPDIVAPEVEVEVEVEGEIEREGEIEGEGEVRRGRGSAPQAAVKTVRTRTGPPVNGNPKQQEMVDRLIACGATNEEAVRIADLQSSLNRRTT